MLFKTNNQRNKNKKMHYDQLEFIPGMNRLFII